MIPFYNLEPQHDMARRELDAAYARVMKQSSFILGVELESFEKAFADYCESDFCVGVGNGLEAIALALKAFGIGPGDDVLVPSHTFIATWLGATQIGARPIPVEPDPQTYNIDPNRLKDALTPKTKAIIPVHLYGQPADMVSIMAFAHQHDLIVIEDAAQAQGATIKGQKVGSFGHAAAFSFYPTKNLGALGDSGAITTSDPYINKKLRQLRNYGSEKKYEHAILAGNSRLDELQAAFLHAKLSFLNQWNNERRAIAAFYTDRLQDIPGIRVPFVPNWNDPVWHQYVINVEDRNTLAACLNDQGIGTMVHYPIPCHLQPAYRGTHGNEKLPIAEQLSKDVLSLPMWPGMSEAEKENIVAMIHNMAHA